MRGKIIPVAGEKGGTGKTMFSTNLAVRFARAGFDTMLFDADQQGSSARWASKRDMGAKGGVPDWARPARLSWGILRNHIGEQLRAAAERYDVVLVDVGGADSEEFHSGVAVADALYTPIIPSDCDVATVKPVDEYVGQVRASGHALVAKVVLNHVSNHVSNEEADEVRAFLEEAVHLEQAQSLVHTRKPFRDAYRQRLGVVECADFDRRTYGKAADEIEMFFAEVCADLTLALYKER